MFWFLFMGVGVGWCERGCEGEGCEVEMCGFVVVVVLWVVVWVVVLFVYGVLLWFWGCLWCGEVVILWLWSVVGFVGGVVEGRWDF